MRNGSASFGVFLGGDNARWLVKQQHCSRSSRQLEWLTIDIDASSTGLALAPTSCITWPLTVTRPCKINSSAGTTAG
jgi:hypothetical protein